MLHQFWNLKFKPEDLAHKVVIAETALKENPTIRIKSDNKSVIFQFSAVLHCQIASSMLCISSCLLTTSYKDNPENL